MSKTITLCVLNRLSAMKPIWIFTFISKFISQTVANLVHLNSGSLQRRTYIVVLQINKRTAVKSPSIPPLFVFRVCIRGWAIHQRRLIPLMHRPSSAVCLKVFCHWHLQATQTATCQHHAIKYSRHCGAGLSVHATKCWTEMTLVKSLDRTSSFCVVDWKI